MMLVVTPIVPLPIFINRIVYLVWSILYFIKLLFEIIDCPRKFLFSMQIPVHCSEEIGFPLNCPTSASPERVFSTILSHLQSLLPLSNSFLLPLWKEYFPKYLSTFKPTHSTVLFSTMRFNKYNRCNHYRSKPIF